MNSKSKKIALYFATNLILTLAYSVLVYMAFYNLEIKPFPETRSLSEFDDYQSNNLVIYGIWVWIVLSYIVNVFFLNINLIRNSWEFVDWSKKWIKIWSAPFLFTIIAQLGMGLLLGGSFIFFLVWIFYPVLNRSEVE